MLTITNNIISVVNIVEKLKLIVLLYTLQQEV